MNTPVLLGNPSPAELSAHLLAPVWQPSQRMRWALLLSGLGSLMLFGSLGYTLVTGIGVWGNNVPVYWGLGIVNFVWWIGIGHAGTFISAVLLLLAQPWRTSINRMAETMTLFAVANAGMYPLAHLGRAWFFYWLLPYPSTLGVWPNFKSALTWDVVAVSTYLTVSLLFWYLGLIPDLAVARDTAPTRGKQRLYGLFALGWRGSVRDWEHYQVVYKVMAGLATALVVSVHTIVSLDFASTKLPGWHATLFPPYFVAGAVFSGFAMVLTLLIPLRRFLALEQLVTARHLENMAKILLATGSVVAYSYILETFLAYYSGNTYEIYTHLLYRPRGTHAALFWAMVGCNTLVPQLFWWKRCRVSLPVLFGAALLINIGMWLERFIIIVTSLEHDFLPASWAQYMPSPIDGLIFAGTLCFFVFLFLLALRTLPIVPISEMKELAHAQTVAHGG